MYKTLTLIFLFTGSFLNGQDCSSPVTFKTMDTHRASFMHYPGASLWWDSNDAVSAINDPTLSSSPASVAFAGGIWFGGIDPAGSLVVRTSSYELAEGAHVFRAGPVTDDSPNNEICELFDRIWEVKKTEIEAHISDWNDNQTIDDPISDNIRLWPGRGNTNIEDQWGTALPDLTLAPFYDINQNGVYEPALGDYPDIRNAEIGQWWIFNDGNSINQITGDFAVLAYSFDNESSTTTTYNYEYKFTNRSLEDLTDMYIGLWVDPDLGCHTDDYVGCKPEENLAYVYNEDAIDGTNGNTCTSGVPTFDINPPIFGIKVLDGTDRWDPDQGWIDNGMSSFSYFNNPSVGNPNPGSSSPENPNEYYNFLTGRWRDGTPMTVGGIGYDPTSTDFTNYAFPDDPDNPDGWNMCNENLGVADRRILISSGPFVSKPGETMKFAFAVLVTGAIPDYPCPSLAPLSEACANAQQVYDAVISDVPYFSNQEKLSIYPNPTTDNIRISMTDLDIRQIELYDINGRLVNAQKNINQFSFDMRTDQLEAGMYWIKVLSESGSWSTEKLIKI